MQDGWHCQQRLQPPVAKPAFNVAPFIWTAEASHKRRKLRGRSAPQWCRTLLQNRSSKVLRVNSRRFVQGWFFLLARLYPCLKCLILGSSPTALLCPFTNQFLVTRNVASLVAVGIALLAGGCNRWRLFPAIDISVLADGLKHW